MTDWSQSVVPSWSHSRFFALGMAMIVVLHRKEITVVSVTIHWIFEELHALVNPRRNLDEP